MKKYTLLTLTLLIILSLSSSALAAPPADRGKTASTATTENTGADKNEEKKVETLKNKLIKEINRRIAALNNVKNKTEGIKRLTEAERTELTDEISKNIVSLEASRKKVQDTNELEALKEQVATIKDSYKVFAFYVPKIHIIASVKSTTDTAIMLSKVADKLEAKITEAEKAGKDVAALKTDLATMRADIESAKTKANTISTAVMALTLDGYPANKTALIENRQSLKSVRDDLISAKQLGVKILETIKTLLPDTTETNKVQ